MKEEKRLKAIVLKTQDVGETDRLIDLLTLQEGRVTIKIKGVRKSTSKLRFATQPFLCGEYLLSPTKTGYVVVGCEVLERFSEIAVDLGAYYAASFVAETAFALSGVNFEDPELFRLTFNALYSLNSGEITDAPLFSLRFLVDALEVSGHGLNRYYCADDCYFSYEDGGIVSQKTEYGFALNKSLMDSLKLLLSGKRPPRTSYADLFELLVGYFRVNVQKKLSSYLEIIKMMDVF